MKQYSILILEDEILAAMSLKLEFEALGQKISGIVKDESRALALCASENVDVVILDINLGLGISGIEIGKSIQRQFGTPILFMTGYELENIQDELVGVEHIGMLKKPAFASDMLQIITRFFENKLKSGMG